MIYRIISDDEDFIERHLRNCRDSCSDDVYFIDEEEYDTPYYHPSGNCCCAIPHVNADWLNFNIRKVIFSNPATIVFWEDGTKTVVKCQEGDEYNKEFGLMACIIKYLTGNNGRWNEIFKDWIKEEEE